MRRRAPVCAATGIRAMVRSLMDRRSSLSGAVLVAAAAVSWGCWPLFVRPSGLPATASAFVATVGMALPAPLLFRRRFLADRGATLALLAVGLCDGGNVALYFAALTRGPVAVAVLTHYLAPLFIAALAPFFYDERRRWRALVAAPVSLGGLGLVVGRIGGGDALGTAALGAGSAAFYAGLVLAAKRAGRTYPPMAISALHAPVSAVAVLVAFGGAALPARLGAGTALVLAGALLCGVGASTLFYRGLARIPVQVASSLTYLEPVTASALGALVFAERLEPLGWAGAALVVAAGLWVALEPDAAPALAASTPD